MYVVKQVALFLFTGQDYNLDLAGTFYKHHLV